MKKTINRYKCGHTTDGIIILDDNEISMIKYLEWADKENNLKTKKECFDCFINKIRK